MFQRQSVGLVYGTERGRGIGLRYRERAWDWSTFNVMNKHSMVNVYEMLWDISPDKSTNIKTRYWSRLSPLGPPGPDLAGQTWQDLAVQTWQAWPCQRCWYLSPGRVCVPVACCRDGYMLFARLGNSLISWWCVFIGVIIDEYVLFIIGIK